VDLIRGALAAASDQPYLPHDYTVWRNYGRVFGVQLLAGEVAGKIRCTKLCHELANKPEDYSADDYLSHFAKRFSYPSPSFNGYRTDRPQVFAVVAILKLLIARQITTGNGRVSVDDIASYLVANQVTGLENLAHYNRLVARAHHADTRQIRELMRFISQFSFLSWRNPVLSIEPLSPEELHAIEASIQPIPGGQLADSGAEILRLGAGFIASPSTKEQWNGLSGEDVEFTEGRKIRVVHLRTERSTKLKDFFFKNAANPKICDICALDTPARYPWAQHVIELHHLLPLASPLKVETGATSIKDLVGLCPTCHRAVHKFYSVWLREERLKDFRTYGEARHVYSEAKRFTVI
jgi:hypothetical protein